MYEGQAVSDWLCVLVDSNEISGVFERSGLILAADESDTEFNAEDDWDAIDATLWLTAPDEESDSFELLLADAEALEVADAVALELADAVALELADAEPLSDSLWLKAAVEDADILGVPDTEKEAPVDAERLGDPDTLTV